EPLASPAKQIRKRDALSLRWLPRVSQRIYPSKVTGSVTLSAMIGLTKLKKFLLTWCTSSCAHWAGRLSSYCAWCRAVAGAPSHLGLGGRRAGRRARRRGGEPPALLLRGEPPARYGFGFRTRPRPANDRRTVGP